MEGDRVNDHGSTTESGRRTAGRIPDHPGPTMSTQSWQDYQASRGDVLFNIVLHQP